jgi:hypothetical protein
MKRIFLLIAITIAALLSSYDLKAEAPERQGWEANTPLYGDVESVVRTQYKLEEKFGEVVRGDIMGYGKYCFNKAGDVIEEAVYDPYNSLRDWKHIYKYDSSGNMIESAEYLSDGRLIDKFIYKYDTSGNIIERAWYDSYGSLGEKRIYKYEYDTSGNMIVKAEYESDGSLREKYIYKYDSSGNMIDATGYRSEALTPMLLTVYEITYSN